MWDGFRAYIDKNYSKSYAENLWVYAKKYCCLIQDPSNLRTLHTFSPSKRDHVVKGLAALCRFLGIYQEFKRRLKGCGMKWSRTSSVDGFLRIMRNTNSDVLEWLKAASERLNDRNLSTFLKFCALSGIRKGEAVKSFNLIIELHGAGKLSEYYDDQLQILRHFDYPNLFLRRTKNVFITAIPQRLIQEIQSCYPITYEMLRKRLHRRGLPVRLDELRDHWGTFMLDHGLIKEEVDLFQGRVGKSIFVRHYWSPAITELRNRVFQALEQLKTEL